MPKTIEDIMYEYIEEEDHCLRVCDIEPNSIWYSEEEYKSLFLDFQKAIDFINKKNIAKELAEFIKKGDD